jgi:hypothetical protein
MAPVDMLCGLLKCRPMSAIRSRFACLSRETGARKGLLAGLGDLEGEVGGVADSGWMDVLVGIGMVVDDDGKSGFWRHMEVVNCRERS